MTTPGIIAWLPGVKDNDHLAYNNMATRGITPWPPWVYNTMASLGYNSMATRGVHTGYDEGARFAN